MKKRKFMLCRYPKNGFGSKSNSFYLLDMLGNRHEIKYEYDKSLEEMYLVVKIDDSFGGVYTANTLDELIESIEIDTDSKIVRW